MAEQDAAKEWVGRKVFDVDGDKIGKVADVRLGTTSGAVAWLVVKTGLIGSQEILIPAAEVRSSSDGLTVPHTKERVKDAPRVDEGPILTDEDEGRLCRYYGLQHLSETGEAADGCVEMTDKRPGG